MKEAMLWGSQEVEGMLVVGRDVGKLNRGGIFEGRMNGTKPVRDTGSGLVHIPAQDWQVATGTTEPLEFWTVPAVVVCDWLSFIPGPSS